mmetsp:Transcript_7943/g.13822  ORF Transcript_7943/g.13822 Transcript_7943/m.13822 type:complete len:414 (-) Transcript_7943:593-1834(-)
MSWQFFIPPGPYAYPSQHAQPPAVSIAGSANNAIIFPPASYHPSRGFVHAVPPPSLPTPRKKAKHSNHTETEDGLLTLKSNIKINVNNGKWQADKLLEHEPPLAFPSGRAYTKHPRTKELTRILGNYTSSSEEETWSSFREAGMKLIKYDTKQNKWMDVAENETRRLILQRVKNLITKQHRVLDIPSDEFNDGISMSYEEEVEQRFNHNKKRSKQEKTVNRNIRNLVGKDGQSSSTTPAIQMPKEMPKEARMRNSKNLTELMDESAGDKITMTPKEERSQVMSRLSDEATELRNAKGVLETHVATLECNLEAEQLALEELKRRAEAAEDDVIQLTNENNASNLRVRDLQSELSDITSEKEEQAIALQTALDEKSSSDKTAITRGTKRGETTSRPTLMSKRQLIDALRGIHRPV